jgi:hypothetical protein
MITRKNALLAAVFAAALCAPGAQAQNLPAPSSAWVRAVIDGLNPATRAEVERRATGGNHAYEVLRVILLNNMQLANLVQPGEAPMSEVVAIDFIREHAVVRQGNALRVVNFSRETLDIRR